MLLTSSWMTKVHRKTTNKWWLPFAPQSLTLAYYFCYYILFLFLCLLWLFCILSLPVVQLSSFTDVTSVCSALHVDLSCLPHLTAHFSLFMIAAISLIDVTFKDYRVIYYLFNLVVNVFANDGDEEEKMVFEFLCALWSVNHWWLLSLYVDFVKRSCTQVRSIVHADIPIYAIWHFCSSKMECGLLDCKLARRNCNVCGSKPSEV